MKKQILGILIILWSGLAIGQDVNFSQFYNNALNLNPALAGNIACKYRLGANYKSQFRTVGTPYITFNASADFKLHESKNTGDIVGAGLILYNDRAGEGRLNVTKAMLVGAYHKNLYSNGMSQYLSFGVSAGFVQKRLDFDRLVWDKQWTGGGFNETLPNGEPNGSNSSPNNPDSYFDLSIGAFYTASPSEDKSFQFGVNIAHIMGAQESLLGDEENTRGIRPIFYGTAFYGLNKLVSIEPAIMYMTQRKANELIIGSNLNYQIEKTSNFLVFGIWARNLRDISPLMGFEANGLKVLFTFDFNINKDLGLAAQNQRGLEIGVTYNNQCSKNTTKKKTVPCLRF